MQKSWVPNRQHHISENVIKGLHMSLRWSHTVMVILLAGGSLFAQENVKIRKGQFRTGIETGFKEAWKSIREADKYFSEGVGTYGLARDLYLYANQYNPANAELNYKIGACYLFTDDKYVAIDYLLEAYRLKEDVSKDIHYLLGQAYHLVLEFENAKEHYTLHKQGLKGDELAAYEGILTKRLSECQNGQTLSQKPRRVIIQNLGDAVNSKYDDYNPVFAHGDSALFFATGGLLRSRNEIRSITSSMRTSTVRACCRTGLRVQYGWTNPIIHLVMMPLWGSLPTGTAL
jgi:hypothetical protein